MSTSLLLVIKSTGHSSIYYYAVEWIKTSHSGENFLLWSGDRAIIKKFAKKTVSLWCRVTHHTTDIFSRPIFYSTWHQWSSRPWRRRGDRTPWGLHSRYTLELELHVKNCSWVRHHSHHTTTNIVLKFLLDLFEIWWFKLSVGSTERRDYVLSGHLLLLFIIHTKL